MNMRLSVSSESLAPPPPFGDERSSSRNRGDSGAAADFLPRHPRLTVIKAPSDAAAATAPVANLLV
eukprot:4817645-Lingulodinium_polyedra.AAC.1